ncbi:MAG: hypothetical protein N3A69_03895 [Leptospiraceae bacterium]|nr:hypothetical protein [Leptospiraceae bacterium]
MIKNKIPLFILMFFLKFELASALEIYEIKHLNPKSVSPTSLIHLLSVRKSQKKPKPSPKEEKEIHGIEEKLDFLDNILEEIEQELNQIEKHEEPNKENNPKKGDESQNSNQ